MPSSIPLNLIATIQSLAALASNYASRPGRVNESNTIRALITPMISALGWSIDDLDEVQSEYRHASTDNPVDYALFLDGTPALFIEVKALDEKLDDRKWIIQTLNYANACNVEWAVLTNGAEWRVYNVHAKAEAEGKLFYSAHVDSTDIEETARRLAMLSKDAMAPKRALDQMWREASVDRAMRKVIEGLPDNRSAVRAMAKASESLSEKDVRDALRRLGLRADWRDEEDLFPTPELRGTDVEAQPRAPKLPQEALDQEGNATPSAPMDIKRIRMPQLLEAGLIAIGDTIHIRNHPGSEAILKDARACSYEGEELSLNAWAVKVTGWSAINIYVHVETIDGKLLQDLRKACAS